MLNYLNKLQKHKLIQAICRPFLRGYEPLANFVPFSHFRSLLFYHRKTPISVTRTVGLILLLWVATASFQTPTVYAEPLSLERLAAKIQEAYEKTKDLKAHFIQEVTIKSMKKTEREEGTVWIKNPKMMLWDYTKPKEKKLVINARKAWLYVAEDRMVYVQNSDDVYRSRMAVRFLSGIGNLSEDFQLRFAKDSPVDDAGNYLLVLIAKEKGTGIDRLQLTIDGKTFQIIQCRFNDDYGNTTLLLFSDIRTNTGVSDKFFTFTTPAGVEVVNMPQ